jgi:hypothetical protein
MSDGAEVKAATKKQVVYSQEAYTAQAVEYAEANSDTARAAAIAKNPHLFAEGLARERKLAREGMQLYARACDWAGENWVVDKLKAARDAALTARVILDVWSWGKQAYAWFRGP